MKTRLRKELHNFLIQYDISLESNIVNIFLFQMAGLKLLRDREGKIVNLDHYGINLKEDTFSVHDKDQEVLLRLPGVGIADLVKFLEFLKIKFNTYHTEQLHLKLSEQFINEFIPAFKKYFATQLETSPEVIAEYRVKSKPILESRAIDTLKQYISEAIETILSGKVDSLDEADYVYKTTIRNFLQAFGDTLERLENHRDIYADILEGTETLTFLMDCDYVKNNKKLENQLQLILQEIVLYNRYQRNDSIFAIEAFSEEMEKYLNDELQISHTCTEVIEDTLLALADVKLGPTGKTKMEVGEDKSRYVFKFEDIRQEEAKKLTSYLRQLGDETVTEGYGYPSHKSAIEVDGKFLHNVLMPLLQIKLNNMQETDPDSLVIYRGESKEYLYKLAVANTPVRSGMLTGNMNALFANSDRAIETSEREAIEIPGGMKIP